MSGISTHILDTVRGEPAGGVVVRLDRVGDGSGGAGPHGAGPHGVGFPGGGAEVGRGTTDADGRIADFGTGTLPAGTYRLTFETGPYLRAEHGVAAPFYPEVVVTFTADGRRPNYHVPLLLSPYSYSTYRGS
ncbi:MAG TPA: hydroxyisourate hydrolase [Streptosporangiaceae bacterium]|nr:hydroxyisourate hydrolase [Streptosporangiaceae bacterium]